STKRLQQIDFRIPEIKNEIETIDLSRIEIESNILHSKESIDETNIKKNKINDDLEILDSERNKILTEQSVAASKKSEIDNKIKLLSDQLNETKLKLSKVENEKEESQIKIKSNSDKLSDLEQAIMTFSTLKLRLESMINNHNASISELKSRISKLNSKKSKTLNDLEELDLILEKSSKAAAQYDTKIKTVKGIMHEDYTVAKLKEDSDKLGIEGLVYEMISWDKQYERSVLAVSSDWIKAIVVPDFATLLGIAEVARSKNLPKMQFQNSN
ncbi:MAG: hypothetical protein HW410_1653, partial [Nitrosarchaeum sp.]|nr:hypothetical protein [Nitrosarchaeum sp.]